MNGMRRLRLCLATLCAIASSILPVCAQERTAPAATWELLGETRVGFNVARDVISVGQSYSFYRSRSYDRLRLTADRGAVRLKSLQLRYINGFEETLPVERAVRPGASVVVELPGRRSYIAQIEVTHSAEGSPGLFDAWLQPQLRVFGLNSRIGLSPAEAEPPPNWTLLGEKTVDFTGSRDVIRLANDEAWYRLRSFDTLHFVVSEGKVRLEDVQIVYINGYAEKISVGRDLRHNTVLAVDLTGKRSYLREIGITYQTWPGSPSRAAVKVFGESRAR
jgi:hypothetical protein